MGEKDEIMQGKMKEWYLKKIPKVLHLYWGRNQNLSFMRYMTAVSFSFHNPDWQIKVYHPKTTFLKRMWGSKEHEYGNYPFEDYFLRLSGIPNLFIEEIDFEKIGFREDISEVFKSDYLRSYLFSTCGGVWSDFDIFYFRPIVELEINLPENEEAETFLCYYLYNSIGFLMSAPFNPLYSTLLNKVKEKELKDYQSIGKNLFDEFFKDKQFHNIPLRSVYIFAPHETDKMLQKFPEIENLPKGTIGVHWYAGGTICWQDNQIHEKNIDQFIDISFFRFMKEQMDVLQR